MSLSIQTPLNRRQTDYGTCPVLLNKEFATKILTDLNAIEHLLKDPKITAEHIASIKTLLQTIVSAMEGYTHPEVQSRLSEVWKRANQLQ